MSARPRGRCPACRREVAVTPAGRMWAHLEPGGALCAGTGQPPRAGVFGR